MRRFAVLLVLCLLGGNAFAMCRTSGLTSEAMAISAAGGSGVAVREYPDAQAQVGYYALPSGSACATSSTIWVADTTTHVYRKVTTCNSCYSGFNLASAYAVYGDCVYEFKMCDTCGSQTTQPSGGQASTYGSSSNCSSTITRYVLIAGTSNHFKVTSCTGCNSGYHLNMGFGEGGSGYCGIPYASCERCAPGKYRQLGGTHSNASGIVSWCMYCDRGKYSDTYEASSCTDCPSIYGISTTTGVNGGNSVTSCCISSGATSSDTTGTYTIDPTCCTTS